MYRLGPFFANIHKSIFPEIVGLNEMECRPPMDYVSIEGNPSTQLTVTVKPNLADHPLVVGPRYQIEDLKCSWSNYLGLHSSGVLCNFTHHTL